MTNIINLADFAAQFGGTTDALKAQRNTYVRKSVDQARSELVERMNIELAIVDAHLEDDVANKLEGLMMRRIRNGYALKIGYGAKNEFFSASDKPLNFPKLEDAKSCLEAMIDKADEGGLDGLLEIKLEELTERAAKARQKKEEKKKAA